MQDAKSTKEGSVATEAVIPEERKRNMFVEGRQKTVKKTKRANVPIRKMRVCLQRKRRKIKCHSS